ncbi:MAG: DinB family protein [Aggregatilineales bacterium]
MQPLSAYRTWQLQQLENNISILNHLIQTADTNAMTLYRDDGTGWTVLEVLGHLHDYEAIFLHRVKLMVEEDFADLPENDPDTLAKENAYNSQDVYKVLIAWEQRRYNYLTFLRGIEDNEMWESAANHPRRGHFTVNDCLFFTVWHDTLHLQQISKILQDQKS